MTLSILKYALRAWISDLVEQARYLLFMIKLPGSSIPELLVRRTYMGIISMLDGDFIAHIDSFRTYLNHGVLPWRIKKKERLDVSVNVFKRTRHGVVGMRLLS